MVDQVVAIGAGIGQISMVSYIIEFLIGFSVVYLTVFGAVRLWDICRTSYWTLKVDMQEAKHEGVSLFRYWKNRVNKVLPASQRA